jgi:hypothetical protein
MIDETSLQSLIDLKKDFRIGTRGICCNCYATLKGWTIMIPRAFIDNQCDELSILSEPDLYYLGFSCDKGRSFVDFLNLMEYDKLTVI